MTARKTSYSYIPKMPPNAYHHDRRHSIEAMVDDITSHFDVWMFEDLTFVSDAFSSMRIKVDLI